MINPADIPVPAGIFSSWQNAPVRPKRLVRMLILKFFYA